MDFSQWLIEFNTKINDFVWVKLGLFLLLGTGVLMTLRTSGFQIKYVGHWMKKTVGSLFNKKIASHSHEKASISQFQALCTALAATVGVGNIAGVAAAIATGGPGAVFWMWIAAFFGMMTSYSESVLGIYYRRKNTSGEWTGGAMYYLQDGLGSLKMPQHRGTWMLLSAAAAVMAFGDAFLLKGHVLSVLFIILGGAALLIFAACLFHVKRLGKILAGAFACFTVLASFGIGNASQINTIAVNFSEAFRIPVLENTQIGNTNLYMIMIGVILMVIGALVIIGGIKRIASVTEKIVPFMVVAYLLGALIVLFSNSSMISGAFCAIFRSAFGIKAVAGGFAGIAAKEVIAWGFKRGVYSNEAGLGSSVIVNSASNVKEPVRQGMWGIFEVFADTIIICTLTALVILTSGLVDLNTGAMLTDSAKTVLVSQAFSKAFGSFGNIFIAISVFLFAFSTVLGWSYYGCKAWEYLFGTKSTIVYKIIFVSFIVFGAVMHLDLAWDISDTFNGLMMIPNLIGVVTLSGTVAAITKNYIRRHFKKEKIPPMLSAFPDIQKQQEEALRKEESIYH